MRRLQKHPRAASRHPGDPAVATRALSWRVPREAPDDVRAAADEALEVILSVMRGGEPGERGARLRAAVRVREEVCGPIVQRLEVAVGGTVYVVDPFAADAPVGKAPPRVRPEDLRPYRAVGAPGGGEVATPAPKSAERVPRRKHSPR